MDASDKVEKELGEIIPEEILGKLGDLIIEGLIRELLSREEALNEILNEIKNSEVRDKLKEFFETELKKNVKDYEEIKEFLSDLVKEKGKEGYTPIGDFFETVGKMSEYSLQLKSYLWEIFTHLMDWMTTYREIIEKISLARSLYIASENAENRKLKKLYKIAALSILGYKRKLPRGMGRLGEIENVKTLMRKLLEIQKKLIYYEEFLPEIIDGIKNEIKEFSEERKEILEKMKEFDRIINKEDYKRFKKIRGTLSKISKKLSREGISEDIKEYKDQIDKVIEGIQESVEKIRKFFKYLKELSEDIKRLEKAIITETKEIKDTLSDKRFRWVTNGKVFKKFLKFSNIKKLVKTRDEEKFLKAIQSYNAVVVKIFIRKNGLIKRTIISLMRISKEMEVLEEIDDKIKELVGEDVLKSEELAKIGGFKGYLGLIKKRLLLEMKDIKTELEIIKKKIDTFKEISGMASKILGEIEEAIGEALEEEKEYEEVIEEEKRVIEEIKKSLKEILSEGSKIFERLEEELKEIEDNILVKIKREAEKEGTKAPEEIERIVSEKLRKFIDEIEKIVDATKETFEKVESISERISKRDISKEFDDILKKLEKEIKKDLKGVLIDIMKNSLLPLIKNFEKEINNEIDERKIEIKDLKKEISQIKKEIKELSGVSKKTKILKKIANSLARGIGKRVKIEEKGIDEETKKTIEEKKVKLAELENKLEEAKRELKRLRKGKGEVRRMLGMIRKEIIRGPIYDIIIDIRELIELKGGKKEIIETLRSIEREVEPVLLDIFDEESIDEAEGLIHSHREIEGIAILLHDLATDSLELLKRLERLEYVDKPREYLREIIEKINDSLDFAKIITGREQYKIEIVEEEINKRKEAVTKEFIEKVSKGIRRIKDEDIKSILLKYFGMLEGNIQNISSKIEGIFRKSIENIGSVVVDAIVKTEDILVTLKELKETIEELEKDGKISELKKASEKKIEEKLGKLYNIRRKFRKRIKKFRKKIGSLKTKTREIVKLPGLR